jgi:hypothetical protein
MTLDREAISNELDHYDQEDKYMVVESRVESPNHDLEILDHISG